MSLTTFALLPEVLPSSPPAFQTPKDISLDQILNYNVFYYVFTFYIHFILFSRQWGLWGSSIVMDKVFPAR